MAAETLIGIAWLTAGLIGGVILNRTEEIDPFAWPLAAVLGLVTLFLGLWERRDRSVKGDR